jgi:hypothetical protein
MAWAAAWKSRSQTPAHPQAGIGAGTRAGAAEFITLVAYFEAWSVSILAVSDNLAMPRRMDAFVPTKQLKHCACACGDR